MADGLTERQYAADPVEGGTYRFYISDDGLLMRWIYNNRNGGSVSGKVSWVDLPTAQANYETCRRITLARHDEVSAKLVEMDLIGDETRSRLIKLWRGRRGVLELYTNTGPPMWWLPRFGAGREKRRAWYVRAGWLRGCFILGWVPHGE